MQTPIDVDKVFVIQLIGFRSLRLFSHPSSQASRPQKRNDMSSRTAYDSPPQDGAEALERLLQVVKSGKPIVGAGAGIGL